MKGVIIVIFIIIGLPVILPLGIIIFWVRCARNFADDMTAWLDRDDTEPVAMVEKIDLDKAYKNVFEEYKKKFEEYQGIRANHDKF